MKPDEFGGVLITESTDEFGGVLVDKETDAKTLAAEKSGYYDGLLSGLTNNETARLRWLANKRFPNAEAQGIDPVDYYFVNEEGDIAYRDPVTGDYKEEFREGVFGIGADDVAGTVFPTLQFSAELLGGTLGLISGGFSAGIPGAMIGGGTGTAAGGGALYGLRAGLSQMLDGPELDTEKMTDDLMFSSVAGSIPFGAPAKSLPRFAENISTRFLGADGRKSLQTIINEGGKTVDEKIIFAQEKYGITLTRPEAQRILTEGAAIQKYLQVQPNSQKLWDFYNNRNLQIQEVADEFFNEIATGKYVRGGIKNKLTGKAGIDADLDVAQAAKSVLKKLSLKRQERASKVYKEAYDLDVNIDVSDILTDIQKIVADPNTSKTKLQVYKELERGLIDQTTKQSRNTTKLLHDSLQDDIGNVIAGLKGVDKNKKLLREVSQIRDQINKRLREANPTFAKANDIYDPTKGHLQILERSIINNFAEVADKGGEKAARITAKLFSGKAKPKEIKDLKRLLQAEYVDAEGVTRSGADAWQNLKGAWLQTQFDDAVVGTVNPLGGPNKYLQRIGIRGDVQRAFPKPLTTPTGMTVPQSADELTEIASIGAEMSARGTKAKVWEAILEPEELTNFIDLADTMQSISYIATQSQSPTQSLQTLNKIVEQEGTKGVAKLKTYALGMFNLVPRILNQGTSDVSQNIIATQKELYQDLLIESLINPKKAADLKTYLNNVRPATYAATQAFARGGIEAVENLFDSPDARNVAIKEEQENFKNKKQTEELLEKQKDTENLQGSIDNFQMPQVQSNMFEAPKPTLAPQQMLSPTVLPNEDDREIAMRQQMGIAGLV